MPGNLKYQRKWTIAITMEYRFIKLAKTKIKIAMLNRKDIVILKTNIKKIMDPEPTISQHIIKVSIAGSHESRSSGKKRWVGKGRGNLQPNKKLVSYWTEK